MLVTFVPVRNVQPFGQQQERKQGLRIPVNRVQGSVKHVSLILMRKAVPGREASVKRMKPACAQTPEADGYK